MKKFRAIALITDEHGDVVDTVGPVYGDSVAEAESLARDECPEADTVEVFRPKRGDWVPVH